MPNRHNILHYRCPLFDIIGAIGVRVHSVLAQDGYVASSHLCSKNGPLAAVLKDSANSHLRSYLSIVTYTRMEISKNCVHCCREMMEILVGLCLAVGAADLIFRRKDEKTCHSSCVVEQDAV